MIAPSVDAASAQRMQPWLSPRQAATYLGITLDDLLPLVEAGQLTLRRAPDQGLRFHLDDLDAVLLAVPPAEAVRLLAAEVSSAPRETMNPSAPTSLDAPASSTLMPLKDAAKHLNQPYKTLLRLVHAGEIPATNIGSPSHPRFVVDPDAIRQLWDEKAQREMRQRSAPVVTVNFSKLLDQNSKGVRRG